MSCKSHGLDATAKRAGFWDPQGSQPFLQTQRRSPARVDGMGTFFPSLGRAFWFHPFQFNVSFFFHLKETLQNLLKVLNHFILVFKTVHR